MISVATSQEMWLCSVISNARRNLATGICMNQGAKKNGVVRLEGDRTVNRHRWMGRESQGVRDNVR